MLYNVPSPIGANQVGDTQAIRQVQNANQQPSNATPLAGVSPGIGESTKPSKMRSNIEEFVKKHAAAQSSLKETQNVLQSIKKQAIIFGVGGILGFALIPFTGGLSLYFGAAFLAVSAALLVLHTAIRMTIEIYKKSEITKFEKEIRTAGFNPESIKSLSENLNVIELIKDSITAHTKKIVDLEKEAKIEEAKIQAYLEHLEKEYVSDTDGVEIKGKFNAEITKANRDTTTLLLSAFDNRVKNIQQKVSQDDPPDFSTAEKRLADYEKIVSQIQQAKEKLEEYKKSLPKCIDKYESGLNAIQNTAVNTLNTETLAQIPLAKEN